MIRVEPAPEPPNFDACVRQPGRAAIAELIGEERHKPRSGPKREVLLFTEGANKGQAITDPNAIPPGKLLSYWTRILPELAEAYGRICAYLCVYIERGTATPTVDHFLPKSKNVELAYEWSNYRLASALMNGRKGNSDGLVDPFEVEDGWLELECYGFQVLIAPSIAPESTLYQGLKYTIDTVLKLNDAECRALRESYAQAYWDGHISWHYLSKRAPFVARELMRQGRAR